MTTSNALVPHPGNYTDEESMLYIYENLPIDEPKSNEVRVCPVPRSFRSAKPEAFTPQFVGLGPYHHYFPYLPMTDELKLGVSRRFLKVPDNRDAHQRLQNSLSDIQIHDFYHIDALPYMLSTDGLFLLDLLRSGAKLKQEYSSNFILTGKHYGLPLVNAAGVELSMDGIIRDVFMLENQIPSLVLKHLSQNINNKNEIKSSDNDLGSVMVNFCKAHSPLVVHSEKISKDPETHDHLLDLMYCLIVSEPQLQPQLDPEPTLRVNIMIETGSD